MGICLCAKAKPSHPVENLKTISFCVVKLEISAFHECCSDTGVCTEGHHLAGPLSGAVQLDCMI